MRHVNALNNVLEYQTTANVGPLAALKALAPSTFTLDSAPVVSPKYQHITTSDIVQHLMGRGWQLDKAGETRVSKKRRESGLAPYVAHTVTLRHPDFQLGRMKSGDIIPNIMLGGSHDRSSSLWMNGGIYRCVCDNQAVVSMGNQFSARFVHMGVFATLMERIYSSIDEMVARTSILGDSINRWQGITLDIDQRHEYFRRILSLRPDSKNKDLALDNVDAFDYRRRAEDRSNDLFTVFQVVQEHTMRGLRLPIVVNGRTQERSLSRGVSGVNTFTNSNRMLWDLTEAYATELTHA